VEAGAIKSINRPVFGIEAVVNEAATVFATQKETDDELRRRARGTLERAGKSTVDAIRYTLIENLPEVTEANMQVVEKPETPGLVEVHLGLDAAPTPDFVQRLEEAIFNSRPAGVRVIHNLPTGTPSASVLQAEDITRQQALADLKARGEPPDVNHLPAKVIASMPQDVMPVRVEVFLRLAQPNVSASQKQSIEDTARATVMDYISNLQMGLPMIYSKLLGLIVAPDNVADAILMIGAEADGSFQSFMGNLSTEGRKAKANAVFVGLIEENVFIDVLARVEQSPSASAGTVPKITDAAQTAVTNALNLKLAASGNGLSKKDLVDAVRDALKTAAPDLQLIADNPVVLNAEYEETGRVLNDTDQVELADHESPVLRKLTVKLKGELDG
jgi:hypothetical protein